MNVSDLIKFFDPKSTAQFLGVGSNGKLSGVPHKYLIKDVPLKLMDSHVCSFAEKDNYIIILVTKYE